MNTVQNVHEYNKVPVPQWAETMLLITGRYMKNKHVDTYAHIDDVVH